MTIRLDKVKGLHLESMKDEENALENGFVGQIGALVDANLYDVKQATTDEELEDPFLLHATEEVDPDPRNAGLKNFNVEAGEAGRWYHLIQGDVYTVTEDVLGGTPVVGEFLVPELDSYLLAPSSDRKTLASNGTDRVDVSTVLKVEEQTNIGYDGETAYLLRVVKA